MGCILGVLAFVWQAVKFVFNTVVKGIGIVVNVFIDVGLALPFFGAVTILLLWLFGVVTPASVWFGIAWAALAVLTVLNIIHNVKRAKKRRRKQREEEEAFKRFKQQEKENEQRGRRLK